MKCRESGRLQRNGNKDDVHGHERAEIEPNHNEGGH